MPKTTLTLAVILSALVCFPAAAQTPEANRAALREIYEEMVEIDSSPTTGSCTRVVRAAEALQTIDPQEAARLRAAADKEIP